LSVSQPELEAAYLSTVPSLRLGLLTRDFMILYAATLADFTTG